jgi:hypothetical protein
MKFGLVIYVTPHRNNQSQPRVQTPQQRTAAVNWLGCAFLFLFKQQVMDIGKQQIGRQGL